METMDGVTQNADLEGFTCSQKAQSSLHAL